MRNKQQLIRLVHVAKRELNMDDDLYRANLKQATGKTSCSNMDLVDLMQALELFKKLGFKVKSKPSANGRRMSPKGGQGRSVLAGKIRAIWITMGKHMVIQDGSETALDAYVRRMTRRNQSHPGGIQSVAWLDNGSAQRVLEALKSWHRRELVDRIKKRGGTPAVTESGHLASYEVIVEQYEVGL